MELAQGWTEQADNWIAWARADGHDSYWRYHRRVLLQVLPPPGRLTLDVGCGEGRVTRDLAEIGHRVIGFDLSSPMVRAAVDHEQPQPTAQADGACLPVADEAADLVLAFMSPQDMDRPEEAIGEAWRTLSPGGRLHLAIVHPINSGGAFEARSGERGPGDAPGRFILDPAYTDRRRTSDDMERAGLRMRFDSEHRPLELYSRWLEDAGFLIELIREVCEPEPDSRWRRLPLFLHLTALKPSLATRDRRLFHISTTADVDRLQAEGELAPPSIVGEGFVHLSRADQVVASTERHFAPDAALVLVELDPEKLVDDVRWPEVYPGERFPHLHGVLRADSVAAMHPWGPRDRARWNG